MSPQRPGVISERETFLDAAEMFAEVCDRLDADDLGRPGLGEWDVRALVGHTLRAVTTVIAYLSAARPERIDCTSAAEYFVLARDVPGADDRAVAERGREAGRLLGDEPATVVRAEIRRARDLLAQVGGDDPVIATVVGGIRLGHYLPTRTFELVAHTLDLAAALDLEVEPPAAALASTLRIATEAALLGGDGAAALRRVLGR